MSLNICLCFAFVTIKINHLKIQIEDGRDGGNIGFGDEDRGQYEDECQHMMTRIKLNYYRAEDEMLIIERIKWRREEEQRKKQWKQKEKELSKLRAQVI